MVCGKLCVIIFRMKQISTVNIKNAIQAIKIFKKFSGIFSYEGKTASDVTIVLDRDKSPFETSETFTLTAVKYAFDLEP